MSSARWSGFRLSKHFVARELAARGHDVLYVDPPVSVGSLARNRSRWRDLTDDRIERAEHRLTVWRPVVLPGQNSAVGQRLNGRLLSDGIARHLGHPDLVICFSLEGRELLRRTDAATVYWATDSIEDQPGFDAARVRQWEGSLVEHADLVVACSSPLAEQLRARGATVVYAPHGVDAGAFGVAPRPPAELIARPRPWVGYAGSINFRVDARMLTTIADGPGTLVVVGGRFGADADPRLGEVLARPDVVVLGHRSHEDLPGVVAALDVGLIPYLDHPFNRKSFPIKALQYLAAGVPVVSTPNGATDELGDAVRVVEPSDDLERAVSEAAADRSDDADSRRRAVALDRSWGATVDRVLTALDR